MKILFIRHGESIDDLTDQFGGWADFDLTPKGKLQLVDSADKVSKLNINFTQIYTSPLIRAKESARIIANKLSIPVEEFVYLKEKNGYGLLSGLNKKEAELKYPEMFNGMKDNYTFGSEPDDKFAERVKVCFDMLTKKDSDNIIAVTHGGFLNQLFSLILKRQYIKAHDGGFVLIEKDESGKVELLEFNNIDFI